MQAQKKYETRLCLRRNIIMTQFFKGTFRGIDVFRTSFSIAYEILNQLRHCQSCCFTIYIIIIFKTLIIKLHHAIGYHKFLFSIIALRQNYQ